MERVVPTQYRDVAMSSSSHKFIHQTLETPKYDDCVSIFNG